MSNYQVTARKWRPQDFTQVIGQEHVTTALKNAITSGKIPHAYLFSGPRGVGKTSTARILAKILNCVNSPEICGTCSACQEISSGQALDVREIDGASNRGIEQIREIRDNVIYTPISLKYKIFIIDEVHMLTKEASNALLKVLEEPPSHIIFMLATTEPNKVLPTIRSRCQHYLLKRIPLNTLVAQLKHILDTEGYPYEQEALEEIAKAGDGSMRDSQTILDQVILYSQGNLTLKSVHEVLGLPEDSYFETIIQAIINQDIVSVLEQLDSYLSEAGDGASFVEHFIKFLRKALLVQKLPQDHALLDLSTEKYQHYQQLVQSFSDKEILILMNLALDLSDTLRKETAERFWIESTLFKMLDYKNRIPLSEIRQEILKHVGRDTKQPAPTTSISRAMEPKSDAKPKVFASVYKASTTEKSPVSIPNSIPKQEVTPKESPIQEPVISQNNEQNHETIEKVIDNLFETS